MLMEDNIPMDIEVDLPLDKDSLSRLRAKRPLY